ncbi:Small polypeptide DEVIL [Trichinella spiralis]|uniref:Small polypeptide DEVIL n=1 Tax=Trichinella spiralis TaxID=6334 RepID=A0ABR3KWI5_TRISP
MVCWPRRTDGNDQRRCDSGDLFGSSGADLSVKRATADAGQRTTTASKLFSKQKPRHALSVVVVVCWKRKRNPTNDDDDWLSPYRNSAPPLQRSSRFSASQAPLFIQ